MHANAVIRLIQVNSITIFKVTSTKIFKVPVQFSEDKSGPPRTMLKRVALVISSTAFPPDRVQQPYSDTGKGHLVKFHAVVKKVT